MNDCLRQWIEQRQDEGSPDVRLYVWLPPELADAGWDVEHALRGVIEEHLGLTESECSVSTTCGTSDVAFSLWRPDMSKGAVHIYIETPGRYPL